MAEHSCGPTQVDFEKQLMSGKLDVEFVSHVLSGHEIVHTGETVGVKVIRVQVSFDWIVELRQIILIDDFVKFFQISQVSHVLLH